MRCATVKVVNPEDKDGGFMIINKSDYDADQAKKKPKFELHEANDEDEEEIDPAMRGNTRNPSGTFSEPTPTDIRYGGDPLATEFENNRGAFVGKSAADMRAERDMEDRPGGLDPDVHDEVKAAEAALEKAKARAEAAKLSRHAPAKLERKLPSESKVRASAKKKKAKSKAKAKTAEHAADDEGMQD